MEPISSDTVSYDYKKSLQARIINSQITILSKYVSK